MEQSAPLGGLAATWLLIVETAIETRRPAAFFCLGRSGRIATLRQQNFYNYRGRQYRIGNRFKKAHTALSDSCLGGLANVFCDLLEAGRLTHFFSSWRDQSP
jgi:hypothetical protein